MSGAALREDEGSWPEPDPHAETLAERRLWAQVLEVAVRDSLGQGDATSKDRDDARAWFRSSSREVGSFVWTLGVLRLSGLASTIRRQAGL